MTPLKLALLGLIRRPVATTIAVLSVALAVGLGGVFLQALGALTSASSRVDRAVDMVIGPKHSAVGVFLGGLHMGPYQHDVLMRASSVRESLIDEVGPRHAIYMARFATSEDGFPVVGVDDNFIQRPEGLYAPTIADGAWLSDANHVVIGVDLARNYGLSVGSTIHATSDLVDPESGPVWERELEVTGVLVRTDTAYDHTAFVRLRTAQLAHDAADRAGLMPVAGYGSDGVTHVLLSLDNPMHYEQMFQIFHVRRGEQVVYVDDVIGDIERVLGSGGRTGTLFVLLMILLASAIVCSLMSARFEALKPSLGLLRALGYRRHDIGLSIVAEALILTVAGVLLGALFDVIVTSTLSNLFAPPQVRVDQYFRPEHFQLWLGTLGAVAVFSIVPLVGLFTTDPHKALQGV